MASCEGSAYCGALLEPKGSRQAWARQQGQSQQEKGINKSHLLTFFFLLDSFQQMHCSNLCFLRNLIVLVYNSTYKRLYG